MGAFASSTDKRIRSKGITPLLLFLSAQRHLTDILIDHGLAYRRRFRCAVADQAGICKYVRTCAPGLPWKGPAALSMGQLSGVDSFFSIQLKDRDCTPHDILFSFTWQTTVGIGHDTRKNCSAIAASSCAAFSNEFHIVASPIDMDLGSHDPPQLQLHYSPEAAFIQPDIGGTIPNTTCALLDSRCLPVETLVTPVIWVNICSLPLSSVPAFRSRKEGGRIGLPSTITWRRIKQWDYE